MIFWQRANLGKNANFFSLPTVAKGIYGSLKYGI
jgi:hypothetical protein